MNKITVTAIVAILIIGGVSFWVYADRNNDAPEENDTVNQMPVNSGENAEGGIHDLPSEPAAVQARKDLAAKLSVDEKNIVIMMVEEKTWSDGCLGLGGPAESCLQALVEGFRVELLAKGETYFYRTDKAGSSVRQE